jgi:hypothetical protein
MNISGQLHAPASLLPGKQHPIPIASESVWPPEPAWILCKREKYLAPAENRIPTPGRSARSLVAIQTELSRLLKKVQEQIIPEEWLAIQQQICTYLLALLEKLPIVQPLRNFPALRNPKIHHRVHKVPPLVPILSQIDPVHTIPSHLSKIHFNIVHPPTSWSS